MDKKEVIAVIVRLFAIILLLYGLRTILPFIFLLSENSNPLAFSSYMIIGITVLLFIAVPLLWLFPYTFASFLLPDRETKVDSFKWDNENVLSCGFIILGVYFLYFVISDAAYWIYVSNYKGSYYQIPTQLDATQKASILATFIEFVLSIFLILGSSGIARLIMKIRGHSAH